MKPFLSARWHGVFRHRRRAASGFTLIEIVVVLMIIALMIGMATLSVTRADAEKKYKEPSAKLKEFARRARNAAVLEQRPYQVEISPRSIVMTPARVLSENGVTPSVGGARGNFQRYDIDFDEVSYSVRPWRAKEYAPGVYVWKFQHSGLSEPITARVQGPEGFVEMTFNPLDAHVDMEESEIQ